MKFCILVVHDLIKGITYDAKLNRKYSKFRGKKSREMGKYL